MSVRGPQTLMPHAISCQALGAAGRSGPNFQPSDVISVLRDEGFGGCFVVVLGFFLHPKYCKNRKMGPCEEDLGSSMLGPWWGQQLCV